MRHAIGNDRRMASHATLSRAMQLAVFLYFFSRLRNLTNSKRLELPGSGGLLPSVRCGRDAHAPIWV